MQTVMIVDDETDTVNLMSETLTFWGFNPVTAENGEEALSKLKETPVDLVITDLRLPKMNGVQLLEKIKDMSASTEVILFTGFPEVGTAIDAMKQGAFDYLTKPVDLNELRLKVERGLEKKNLVGTNRTLRGLNWAMILSIPVWLALGVLLAYAIK